MVAPSLAVISLGALLFLVALLAFVWALATGQLDDLDAQAALPLEPEDARLLRPWETPEQQRQRAEAHGPPLLPRPGEWGGSW